MNDFIVFDNVKKTYKIGDIEINASDGVEMCIRDSDIFVVVLKQ